MSSTKSQLGSALKWLQRNFPANSIDQQYIDALSQLNIVSLAYTADGGFDPTTGEFHSDNRAISYKIRLKYIEEDATCTSKTLVLMGANADQTAIVDQRAREVIFAGDKSASISMA